MDDLWQPLSVRRGVKPRLQREEPFPSHSFAGVVDLIRKSLSGEDVFGNHRIVDARIARVLLRLQMDRRPGADESFDSLLLYMRQDDDLVLDVLDVLLAEGWLAPWRLADFLDASASTWAVVDGELVERVSPPAVQQYEAALEPRDEAARHLGEAWGAAFGLDPDPSAACAAATRAVEAVLKPITTPNDSKATFGKMRKAIVDAPSKFEFVLDDDPTAFLPYLNLAEFKPGRHGGDDKAPPTIEEARATVHGAVTVVEWLRSGVFRRAG